MNDEESTDTETVQPTTDTETIERMTDGETVDPTTDEVMIDTETVEPTTETEPVEVEVEVEVEPTAQMEPVEGEVVEPMGEKEAKRTTEFIRLALDNATRALDRLAELVPQAHRRRADLAMGYSSWEEYVEAEFAEGAHNLHALLRRKFVGQLATAGMSTRAIAPVVGVVHSTVTKDLNRQELPTEPPDAENDSVVTGEVLDDPEPEASKVVGLDLKTYPRHRSEPTEEQKAQQRAKGRLRGAESAFHNAIKYATSLRKCSLAALAASFDAAMLGADADRFRDVATCFDKAAEKAQTLGEDRPDKES